MKRLFFTCCVLTSVLCSCNNDTEQIVDNGDKASLQLTIASAATRATGANLPTAAEENVVTRVTVALFKPDGSTDAISEGTLDASKKITVSGTAGVRDVVVVANAPAAHFKGVTTKDAFRKTVMALTQTKTLLPMSGEATAAITLKGGETVTGSVTITRLVARVQLTGVKTAFDVNGPYANASFSLDKVFLYRVMSKSQAGIVPPATAPVTTDLIDGWDGTTAVTASADLLDVFSAAQSIGTTPYEVPYYFYAFENYFANDGTTTHGITNDNKTTATKLVLAGYFTPDAVNAPGTSYYVFYPAVVNRAQAYTIINADENGTPVVTGVSNTGIAANNIYSLKATIKSRGVDSPAEFMEPAGLELEVLIAPWKLTVTQEVDF